MEVFRNDAKAGVFIILAFLAFLIAVFKIGGGLERLRPGTRITLAFENVQQLDTGSDVFYRGKEIGKVSAVRFSPEGDRVLVVCNIEPGTRLLEGTGAKIVAKSALGGKLVELIPPAAIYGSEMTRPLDTAKLIEGEPASGLNEVLDKLDGLIAKYDQRAEMLLKRIEAAVGNLDQALVAAKTQVEGVGQTRLKLDYLLDTYVRLAGDLNGKVDLLVSAVDEALAGVGPMTDELKQEVSALTTQMRGDIGEIKGNLNRVLASADRLAVDADLFLREHSDSLAETVVSLRRTVHNFEEFSAIIAERPSALIRKGKKKKDKRKP